MSNEPEKMPEKIWIDTDDGELFIPKFLTFNNGLMEYTRTDTIPDVAELQRQNAVLKTLFRKLFDEASWTVYDTIQSEAREAGAIIPHEVTKDDVDNIECDTSDIEVGDTIYMLADWMQNDAAKMPIPARAEVARVFMEEAKERAVKLTAGQSRGFCCALRGELEKLLAEWEEADGNKKMD